MPIKARRHLEFGSMRIDLLPEVEHRMMPVGFLFPTLSQDDMLRNADWLGPEHLDATNLRLGMAFQAYVIRTNGLTVLVDSCCGNHKQRPTALWQHDLRSSAFLDNLAALGLRPEDIDLVLCTHLHCDHVGWNTRLEGGRWVPTFPNARHIFNRTEFDHYNARYAAEGPSVSHGAFQDSVLPIVDAGQAEFVDDRHRAIDGEGGKIFLSPSPGHSPGHVCVHVCAGDEEAIIAGDALHHAIQLAMPSLIMRVDADPDQAIATRRGLLDHCTDHGSWLLAGHIPYRSISRIRRHLEGYRFVDDS